jgi:hypothetical protein
VKQLDRSALSFFVLGRRVVWSCLEGREVGRRVSSLGADHYALVIGVDHHRLMTWSVAGSRNDSHPARDLPVSLITTKSIEIRDKGSETPNRHFPTRLRRACYDSKCRRRQAHGRRSGPGVWGRPGRGQQPAHSQAESGAGSQSRNTQHLTPVVRGRACVAPTRCSTRHAATSCGPPTPRNCQA